MQRLLNLLTEDIVFIGDGGGKVRVGHKVHGPDKVARGTLAGLSQGETIIVGVQGGS